MQENCTPRSRASVLALAALGVVYGDIGTSPLYALRECFSEAHGLAPDPGNVVGVLSLIFWSLLLLVSGKYVALILRADNQGEGGILALLALAFPPQNMARAGRRGAVLIAFGVLGAAMLYGDGTITPAITVLGAMEGLDVATPAFRPWIVPLAVLVLIGLFSVQRLGTGSVGKVFGPVMLVWFLAIAALGVGGVVHEPGVLWAVNPWYGLRLLVTHAPQALVILSSVFLVLTGAEALYADMGHFGRKPIRRAWFAVVLPALFLNYLGQGALLLQHPAARDNPFFQLAPSWGVLPLVGLATAAAVIASQALISGAFSLTVQAMQLGYAPRMEVTHTSPTERGQVYVPQVNGLLLVTSVGLVIGFGSSSRLAAAYGIAVITTMVVTTVLFYCAARRAWGWSVARAGAVCAGLLVVEAAFLAANAAKILHGGWFPILLAGGLFVLMQTWKRGRSLLRDRLKGGLLPLDAFLDDIDTNPPPRVSGTAVFLSANPEGTPLALLHNFKHNKVLHGRLVVMTIMTANVPHVASAERVQIEILRPEVFRVIARFGFMEDPTMPEVLECCRVHGLDLPIAETTFFLSRETIVPLRRRGWRTGQARLFALLSRNAQSATEFFHLPANRVVELGMQIEL